MLDAETARTVALQALPHYGWGPADTRGDGVRLRLLSLSENATFAVGHGKTGQPALILRIHRPDYQSRRTIESELAWMRALRETAGVTTPDVITTTSGEEVLDLGDDLPARFAVAFTVVPGVTGEEAPHLVSMSDLGATTARMHLHAAGWERPAGFRRFSWDAEACLGVSSRWGPVSAGPGVSTIQGASTLLDRTTTQVRSRLATYGRGPDRFGLVHADLRQANLMVDPDAAGPPQLTVIDFDDAGYGWYLYDLAAAISWLEHQPATLAAAAEWINGYRTQRPLTAEDLEMVPVFVMMRRLMLNAWLGSHPDSPPAQAWGTRYAAGTVDLADRFLSDPDFYRFRHIAA